MAEKRISKEIIDKKEIDYLLSLTEYDLLATTTIMELFGDFGDKKRFEPYDTIKIPANSYGPEGKKNKAAFVTTVGLYVFNKCFIEKDLLNVIGYINKPLNKKTFGEINAKMSYAVLEDDIDLQVMKRYVMKTQKYMPYVSILSPNHTMKMLTITKDINKRKKELLSKYSKEIAAKDEKAAVLIEEELMKYAKELLKDDPSMDMYDSDAKGSFGNNFKNMFIMKGVVKDPDPNKGYNIATSNYMDGVSKDEYAIFANSLSAGPYARAKKTSLGGYWEKLFLSALQHAVLDKAGSDCGTKRYITIDVDKDNIGDIMYCYVVEGSRLVEINSKNMNSYIGKTIKMRYSSLCESKTGFCNKCCGDLFYKLKIYNIGTATPQIPSKLKTTSMKGFHDSQVKLIEMDPMHAFGM